MLGVFVSVTGFVPKTVLQLPRFWWHTSRCLAQARRSPGNLGVTARLVDGVYHTMTVWTDEESMRGYVRARAHRKAMLKFRKMGSGRTCGFYTGRSPAWGEAYKIWLRLARDV